MITLTYDTNVRAAAWADDASARVFTVAGYARKNGADPVAAVQRATERGHDLVGVIYMGGALVGDRKEGARLLAKRLANAASAVTLATGDLVEIDCVAYSVRFPQDNERLRYPRNCDPIHFVRA